MARKLADVMGTYVQPLSSPSKEGTKTPDVDKSPVKTGSEPQPVPGQLPLGKAVTTPPAQAGVMQPAKHAPKPAPGPYVADTEHDTVTGAGLGAHAPETKKACYAWPDRNQYPLNTHAQVLEAMEYFSKHASEMSLVDRRMFAVQTAARGEELCITVPALLSKYASQQPSELGEFGLLMATRQRFLSSDRHPMLEAVTKLAAEMPPLQRYVQVEEFDKAEGLHHFYGAGCPDPIFTCWGSLKEAEEKENGRVFVGSATTSTNRLESLAKLHYKKVMEKFGPDFASSFRQSPKSAYDGLTEREQRVLINMANALGRG